MNNWPSWITTQAHTGSQFPYYLEHSKSEKEFFFDINKIIDKIPPEKRKIETSSIIEILYKGYIFGDKTLVKGIKRIPWLSSPDSTVLGEMKYLNIPKHGTSYETCQNIAVNVERLLHEELMIYIGNSKKVGILLSGGLDSRIIAGILRKAQLSDDFNGDVIVYNWGMQNSRDVVYAKEIAKLYEWEYIHFPITYNSLKENMFNVSLIGAEISPIHLHEMIKVRDDLNSDIIIAGTYGDSLGRGLYSGTHVSNLKNLMEGNINKLGLIKEEVIKEFISEIESNYYIYKDQIIDKKNYYQLREVEQNVHYLRRLLSTAMSIIAQKKPIYQMFTHPGIVKYVWNLDVRVRNDGIYKEILRNLPEGIGEIPYAKTGKSFISDNKNKVDTYLKDHHKYSSWLRNELNSFIDEHLNFNTLNNLNIFNESVLKKAYNTWLSSPAGSLKRLDTIISWLTAFSIFVDNYEMKNDVEYKTKLVDKINSLTIIPKIQGYQTIRNRF